MALIASLRRTLRREPPTPAAATRVEAEPPASQPLKAGPQVEIAGNDPLLAYLQSAPGPVELVSLELDSPAVRDLRAAGIALVVPLISQG